jgi:hypothetical protein
MRRQLESCGRLQWVLQESAAQLAGESEFDPERQMRRASRGEPLRPAATTLLRGLVLIWWRRRHPEKCAPAFVLRNQRHLPTALRELSQPLTR